MKKEYSTAWFIECGLQIIAISLCALILINMGIEDQQPPKAACVENVLK